MGGVAAPTPGSLLSYSSSTLARPAVDLELHVELHVYGRARPGADLNLFGRRVALRPDGSFSFRRPLRNGAIVVPVLFADEGGPLEVGEG
jgi:hypothetical protein